MRSISFLTLYIWFFISFDVGVTASEKGEIEEKWKVRDKKDEVKPPRPSFPLFTLPSFSQLSLPTFNFPQIPYLQGLSNLNRVRSPPNIRPTKTEYVEVTRRQTIHPVCYTAYEAKSPCLTYDHNYDEHEMDFDSFHETQENFDISEVKKFPKTDSLSLVLSTSEPEVIHGSFENRFPKYLEFNAKRVPSNIMKTATRVQEAELVHPTVQFSTSNEPAEFYTKTVLITKLEKYTDRRVTATLSAVNCLPVHHTIPLCQVYSNPIVESPNPIYDDVLRVNSNDYNVRSTTTSLAERKSENDEINMPTLTSSDFTTIKFKNYEDDNMKNK